MPTSASAAKTALNRLLSAVALRRAASSPRHRIAMRPSRAVDSHCMLELAGMFARCEQQREQGAPISVVRHRHVTAMRLHGFLDDGKPEPGTFRLRPFAAP